MITLLVAAALPLWTEPAQPNRYLEAGGRRSIILGDGAGVMEAWLFPVKVLHDFRLLVQTDGSLEPAEVDRLATRVETTPAATTVVYAHAAFTLRETFWAPRDLPAVVMELDVESSRPLTVYAQFRNDLKPMWPASLGGVYNAWLAADKAMLLAEPTRRVAALIASDAFDAHTDEGDHMLPDRPTVLRLKPFPAGRSRVAIILAGGMGDREAARKVLAEVRGKLDALRSGAEDYWSEFLDRTTSLETPDAEFNRAFLWGRIAMEKGFACNEGLGCGLIAGWGPSGASERPGFGWYFGGDAFMNIPALLDYGDFEGARAALEFLRARQRPDGKMMHEMTMSAALMKAQGGDWFSLPYAYYHADTTPLYIVAARAYFARSGDRKFLEESWSSVQKALQYCLTTVDETDGLMSNLKAGMAAVETGVLRGKVQKDIYLQGFWLAALDAFASLAEARKEREAAGQARARLERARTSLHGWFSEGQQRFPFGRLTDNSMLDSLTAWPAVALAFGGLDERRSRAGVDALARPELMTGWGARWVATDSGLYNPLGYNDGSVWPFMTGYVIQAQYRHHRAAAAFQTLTATAGLTGFSGAGFVPENFSGDRRQTLTRSVPHQLFSAGVGVIQSAISGMLGLTADAEARVLRLTPHLPETWDHVRVRNYRVGPDRFDIEIRRESGRLRLRVESKAQPPYRIEWSPALPAGTKVTGGIATDRDIHVPNAPMTVEFQRP